jgi:MFS family permease
MANFTPLSAAIGGALIGLASALLMIVAGRIAGISGILGATLGLGTGDRTWRIAFIAGLILAPVAAMLVGIRCRPRCRQLGRDCCAGLLVGFGARTRRRLLRPRHLRHRAAVEALDQSRRWFHGRSRGLSSR